MARLDDIDLDIKNAVLRANATDREEIARILRYLYRLSGKLKWWQTKLDRGNLTEEERKVYEGLITGEEEIRQELAGKVDSDQMADATHNGLMSMLDWPKLQFSMIPKNIDMDTYALGMGMYFASTYNVSTLTHYPTSEESVLLCIGEPDYQYQLVMEVDSSTPKIYGRPVYFYEPRTAWKELQWIPEDTSVTFDSIRNTSNTSGGAGTLRRIGKTVNLYFSATLTNALTASTWLGIGALPVGYRPKESIYTQGSTIGGTLVRVYLGELGGIQVWCPAALSGGTLVHGVLTWFTA